MIKDIQIIGGIHNSGHYAPHGLTEEKLEKMVAEMATIVQRYTLMDSWLTIVFTKEVGGKINS